MAPQARNHGKGGNQKKANKEKKEKKDPPTPAQVQAQIAGLMHVCADQEQNIRKLQDRCTENKALIVKMLDLMKEFGSRLGYEASQTEIQVDNDQEVVQVWRFINKTGDSDSDSDSESESEDKE